MHAVLIGAGSISEYHLKASTAIPGFRIVAIADTRMDRANELASQYELSAYTDYKLMIEQLRPELAIVALPHFLHRDAAVFCANHGCHLLLEKPMAISTQDCLTIMEAVERNKVSLLVGQTQQYIAQNLAAKSIIRLGELGKLVMIHEKRHGPYFTEQRPAWFLDKSMSGGGIVFNLGNHSIDKIQWLTDTRIQRVRASLSYYADSYPDIEGSAALLLETSAGVPCTVSLNGYESVRGEETELIFTHGMMKIVNHQSVSIALSDRYEEYPVANTGNPFELQLLDLLGCIREGRQPYASGEYALSVVRVVEAVYESADKGEEICIK